MGESISKMFQITTTELPIAKMNILEQVVRKTAERLLVGKNAVPIQRVTNLDVRLAIPKATEITAEEVEEGALAEIRSLEWFNANTSLQKYQCHLLITDEAVERGLVANQVRVSVDAAARGLQKAEDKEIFDALSDGAGQSVAATATWDADTADPVGDVLKALKALYDVTTFTEEDQRNLNLFCPAKVYSYLKKTTEINNIMRRIDAEIKESFGIANIYPTRQLTSDALLVLKSQETAIHFVYAGTNIKTMEEVREPGVGVRYVMTNYFKTVVVPSTEGVATSDRIVKITGVA